MCLYFNHFSTLIILLAHGGNFAYTKSRALTYRFVIQDRGDSSRKISRGSFVRTNVPRTYYIDYSFLMLMKSFFNTGLYTTSLP